MALYEGLLSYYKLDEVSGSALDAHGGNNLSEVGGSLGTTTGKLGGARTFNKTQDYHFGASDSSVHDFNGVSVTFTISIWLYPISATSDLYIFSKYGSLTSQRQFHCRWVRQSTRIIFTAHGQTTSWSTSATSQTLTNYDTWYHLVAWFDLVNREVGVVVNNNSPVTSSISSGFTSMPSTTAVFNLGTRLSQAENFNGSLDEVGIWDRVLTSSEISQLYNGGNGLSYEDIMATQPPEPVIPKPYQLWVPRRRVIYSR